MADRISPASCLVKWLAWVCLISVTGANANDEFIDDAINELGFDTAQRAELESGKIISVGLPDLELQPTELAVGAVMMLVRRPLATVSDVFLREETFRVNAKILDFGEIGDRNAGREGLDAVFSRIGYTAAESEEAGKLLKVKPGKQFNFSQEEIDRFRSIQSTDRQVLVESSGVVAGLMQNRYLDYFAGGLPAVEPYARTSGSYASPQTELSTAFSASKLVQKYFPTFFTSLSEFPAQLPENTESRFYWIKRLADDRPAFALSHRLVERTANHTVVMDLQYYVQHSYNSMFTLIACVPVGENTLVLSGVRLFTDRVTGFASGTRKKIGRKHVAEATSEYFQRLLHILEDE